MKFPHPRNQEVLKLFGTHRYVTLSGGGNFSSKAFVISDVLDQHEELKKLVWVVNDSVEQETAHRVLKDWTDFEIETLDEEEGHHGMMRTLASLMSKKRKVAVVVNFEQVLALYPRKENLVRKTMEIKEGDELDPSEVFEELIDMQYEVSEDQYLEPGQYLRHGDILDIFPLNSRLPVRIELDFDVVSKIYTYEQNDHTKVEKLKTVKVYPLNVFENTVPLWDYLGKNALLVEDELDLAEDLYREVDSMIKKRIMREFILNQPIIFEKYKDIRLEVLRN